MKSEAGELLIENQPEYSINHLLANITTLVQSIITYEKAWCTSKMLLGNGGGGRNRILSRCPHGS